MKSSFRRVLRCVQWALQGGVPRRRGRHPRTSGRSRHLLWYHGTSQGERARAQRLERFGLPGKGKEARLAWPPAWPLPPGDPPPRLSRAEKPLIRGPVAATILNIRMSSSIPYAKIPICLNISTISNASRVFSESRRPKRENGTTSAAGRTTGPCIHDW